MRNSRLILLLGIIVPFFASAQSWLEFAKEKGDTIMYAYNSDWEPISNFYVATYYRKAWPEKGKLYRIRDYYKDGSIQMDAIGTQPNPFFSAEYKGDLVRYSLTGDTLSFYPYNKDGKLHGILKTFHENGKLSSIGTYRDGDVEETWQSFYDNGQVSAVGRYEDGNREGEWKEFYSNGQLSMKAVYLEGNPQDSIQYFHRNGAHERTEYYTTTGMLHGAVVYKDSLGNTLRGGVFEEGKRKGLWQDFFDTGQKGQDSFYERGKLEGPSTVYYRNGRIRVKSNYHEGQLDGNRDFYLKDGTLERREEYLNGNRHGLVTAYWPSGKAMSELTYENGSLEDEKWFAQDGAKIKKESLHRFPQLLNGKSEREAIISGVKLPEKFAVSDRLVVSYTVDKIGNVTQVKIRETANDSVDSLIVNLVRTWKFTPGIETSEKAAFGNELAIAFDHVRVSKVNMGTYYRVVDLNGAESPSEFDGFIIEENPKYIGGEAALFGFLGSEMKYPSIALDAGISGIVYLQFVVERSGLVSSFEILRKVHPALDLEAIRVTRLMSEWKPGYQEGKSVRVTFKLPLRFTLR